MCEFLKGGWANSYKDVRKGRSSTTPWSKRAWGGKDYCVKGALLSNRGKKEKLCKTSSARGKRGGGERLFSPSFSKEENRISLSTTTEKVEKSAGRGQHKKRPSPFAKRNSSPTEESRADRGGMLTKKVPSRAIGGETLDASGELFVPPRFDVAYRKVHFFGQGFAVESEKTLIESSSPKVLFWWGGRVGKPREKAVAVATSMEKKDHLTILMRMCQSQPEKKKKNQSLREKKVTRPLSQNVNRKNTETSLGSSWKTRSFFRICKVKITPVLSRQRGGDKIRRGNSLEREMPMTLKKSLTKHGHFANLNRGEKSTSVIAGGGSCERKRNSERLTGIVGFS